jgi:hypothetical protein
LKGAEGIQIKEQKAKTRKIQKASLIFRNVLRSISNPQMQRRKQ